MSADEAAPATRRELAQWRREQLIDAAMAVFGTKGIDAASMKEVAAAAGVTPGLLYHYFAGKEALVVTVIAERGFLPELRRLLSVAGERPAAEVLPEILAGFDRLVAQRSDLVRMLLAGTGTNATVRGGLEAVVTEGQQLLGEYLGQRVRAGELRPHDPTAVAQMLLSTRVLGHVIGVAADPDSIIDVLLRGLITACPDQQARPTPRRGNAES